YLPKVLSSRVYDIAIETELQPAINLSQRVQNEVLLKREDTQPVFSFKIRGAYNKIAHCSPEQLSRGVVACSAGNHAQGVALSASKLGVHATIVMPLATPLIKVNAVRNFGGPTVTVKLHGMNYDEAAAEAMRLEHEDGLTLIHPFDDPYVIAGQGTVGMEILKARNGLPLDAIFCCVGGGGLLAGVAAYVKQVRPEVKVIGVEAADAPGMTSSLAAGQVLTLPHVGLFADGAAVRTTGSETFRICEACVDDMVTVSTDQICQAIKLGFNDTRCIMEPAGALAVAGARKYLKQWGLVDKTVAVVTSGANMDFDRLRFVSERADSSETLFSVTIPERPGTFRELHSLVAPRNVTEFSYRWADMPGARILLSFQSEAGTTRREDAANVHKLLSGHGYDVLDLSDNELAKMHARHFGGGRSPLTNERLFRFEFPEAPGALSLFLKRLSAGWNVSLFHYRNHGSDFGRVLVGLQTQPEEHAEVQRFLDDLGYTVVEETDNPVFGMHIR
ncbi:unnamed protein product, partial [Chrysoparadoxa australica]